LVKQGDQLRNHCTSLAVMWYKCLRIYAVSLTEKWANQNTKQSDNNDDNNSNNSNNTNIHKFSKIDFDCMQVFEGSFEEFNPHQLRKLEKKILRNGLKEILAEIFTVVKSQPSEPVETYNSYDKQESNALS